MTTWREYNQARPLRGEAVRAYERERAKMGVGYLVLKARAAARMTQAALARKIGSTQPMIARWESGAQVPNLTTMMKIAEATGYDLAIGLHDPAAPDDRFDAIAYVERTGRAAALHTVREHTPKYQSTPDRASAKGSKRGRER